MPAEARKKAKVESRSKLEVIQNKCLRVIAGAYKATPIEVLQAETHIPPLTQHLDRLQAKMRSRISNNEQEKIIKQACNRIQVKLRGKRGQSRVAEKTPGTRKREWVTKMTKDAPKTVILDQPSPPPWTTIDEA